MPKPTVRKPPAKKRSVPKSSSGRAGIKGGLRLKSSKFSANKNLKKTVAPKKTARPVAKTAKSGAAKVASKAKKSSKPVVVAKSVDTKSKKTTPPIQKPIIPAKAAKTVAAKPLNGKAVEAVPASASASASAAAAPATESKTNKNGAPAAAPVVAKRGKVVVPKVSLGARTEPIRISVSSDLKTVPRKVEEPKSAKLAASAIRFPQNAPVPQPPVPTDGKPRRNLAGLNSRDLEHFRELLLAKRRELVGDMSAMEREALRSANGSNLSNLPLHMADQGTDNYEQEFTLGLVEKDRNLLREINRGLAKIQDGTYGICEGTGKPINKARLEAQPWAKYSIEHARMMERGMMIRR